MFHDITSGNNSVPNVTGYNAVTGYDLASGLGSVDAAQLINNWALPSQKATPTFTLTAASSSLSVTGGSSGQIAVSTTPQGGFNSAIALSVSGLPSGVTASLSATTVSGSAAGSSTITLTAATTAKAGTYSIVVTAIGGGLTKTATVSLVLTAPPDAFNLSLAQSALTVKTSASAQSNVTTANVGIFNSSINLSVTGLPTGVTASFSKPAIAAPGNGTVTFTIAAASTAKAGTYTLTVSANGGGQTKTSPITLTIAAPANFTLGVNTTSISMAQGGAASAVVVSIGGYTGGFNWNWGRNLRFTDESSQPPPQCVSGHWL